MSGIKRILCEWFDLEWWVVFYYIYIKYEELNQETQWTWIFYNAVKYAVDFSGVLHTLQQ